MRKIKAEKGSDQNSTGVGLATSKAV